VPALGFLPPRVSLAWIKGILRAGVIPNSQPSNDRNHCATHGQYSKLLFEGVRLESVIFCQGGEWLVCLAGKRIWNPSACDGSVPFSTWGGRPVLVNRSIWAVCSAWPKAPKLNEKSHGKFHFLRNRKPLEQIAFQGASLARHSFGG